MLKWKREDKPYKLTNNKLKIERDSMLLNKKKLDIKHNFTQKSKRKFRKLKNKSAMIRSKD